MMNRREFFKTLARSSALAALGVTAGVLAFREKEESCDFDFVCKNCRKVSDCMHPEANFYRKHKGIQSNKK